MPESYPSRWDDPTVSAADELAAAVASAVYVLDGNGCHGTALRLRVAFEQAEGHFVPRGAIERFSGTSPATRVD